MRRLCPPDKNCMFCSDPKTVTVPCDWCGKEIGEECLKCGGSGVIVMAQRKAS